MTHVAAEFGVTPSDASAAALSTTVPRTGYHYLVRVATSCGKDPGSVAQALQARGLHRRTCSGPIDIFAAPSTPTLQFPDGSLLIGYVFSREGTRLAEATQFPSFSDAPRLRRHLIQRCWGEYVLMQFNAAGLPDVMVLRDPSGGVPCLYFSGDGALVIASDVELPVRAGLLTKRIDWEYLERCLAYPHPSSQRTGWIDVKTLLPGCVLSRNLTDVAVTSEWSPWEFLTPEQRITDFDEAAGAVRRTVATAVNAWADVDRAIVLEMSGGLDSSIVAACLRDADARVACCTLLTPDPGADERRYAQLMADALGVPLHIEALTYEHAHVAFEPAVQTAIPRIGCLQVAIDDVMGAAGHRHDAAASYTGAGGDTVFAYLTNASPAADAFAAQGVSAGLSAMGDLSRLHQCTLWTAAWLTLRKRVARPRPPLVPQTTFVRPMAAASKHDPHPWFDAPAGALSGDRERVFGLAQTQVYREIAPRASERFLRMPLLAQPVVETCLRIPSWLWISGGQNRAVARAAFADRLPPQILARRSKGNFIGYLGGVYRRNRPQIRDLLLSGRLRTRGLLDTEALTRFLDQAELPSRDRSFLEVLDLCMIENWVRHQG